MSIPIIDTLYPLGNFPAVNADDVQNGSERLTVTLSSIENSITGKVDKTDGKGLSSNDYTTAEKDKLSGIEANATKTIVDSFLSSTSTNPLQNKIIKAEFDEQSRNMEAGLSSKADVSTMSELANIVDGKADSNTVSSLSEQVSTKYSYVDESY